MTFSVLITETISDTGELTEIEDQNDLVKYLGVTIYHMMEDGFVVVESNETEDTYAFDLCNSTTTHKEPALIHYHKTIVAGPTAVIKHYLCYLNADRN